MAEPLQKIIKVAVKADKGDVFLAERSAAVEAVKEQAPDAILISWKNNLTGESSPAVESCRCGFEGWELYAITRGATVRVEINGGELIFMFRPMESDLTVF